jgi:hypothetical protein
VNETVEDPGQVNPHYLNHVVATTANHAVEVTEDIVSGNGIKLVSCPANSCHCDGPHWG